MKLNDIGTQHTAYYYCDTETAREAAEITVVDLKRFELAYYARVKLSWSRDHDNST